MLDSLLQETLSTMLRQVTRAVATLRPTLARFCSDGVRNIPTYHPDSLDKKILVHFKYFKTIEEIPHRVSGSMMAQAKSKARIKMANVMIGTTISVLASPSTLPRPTPGRTASWKRTPEDI